MMRTQTVSNQSHSLSIFHASRLVTSITFIFLAVMLINIKSLSAGVAKLQWDPVNDSRVDHYEIQYGLATGQYQNTLKSTSTTANVEGLNDGAIYYFSARACDPAGTNCSAPSNEVAVTIPQSVSEKTSPALQAAFTASAFSGTAPLMVTFSDQSTGSVQSRAWSFGDGGASTSSLAVYTYGSAGTYTVNLTVKDGAGAESAAAPITITVLPVTNPSDTADNSTDTSDKTDTSKKKINTALPIEIGDLEITNEWQWIDFQQTFVNPVVVVKGLGFNDQDPAIVRVKGVTADGFWVRVQEWDYLDGWHTTEKASYIAMERGSYDLPDGTRIEAGSLSTKATGSFQYQAFGKAFKKSIPVVFAAVTSANEQDAVNARIRGSSLKGFFVGMREQEKNKASHVAERVDYIAWQASKGEVGGLRFEVGRTGNSVTQTHSKLAPQTAFAQDPIVVLDAQTTNDSDTFSLRWSALGSSAGEIWAQEEQSKDKEMTHRKETVGYFFADVE